MDDDALVLADPVPLPALLPTVLLTSTGVSYFNNENPCCADEVVAY